ncbi:MAG TPA: hypothetical protein VK470_11570 [Bacteroidota bacterium]|nr:hypothetical protein [Bacteroidota bacterium]
MTVLLFVATIVVFLGIDYFVRRAKGEAPLGASARTQQTARAASSMRFPEGVFFSKTHTWLNLSPSGKVRLGVDDFLSRMFTAPELTLLKGEGEQIAKGEAIMRMKEAGKSLTVFSPIDGRITRRNSHFDQSAARTTEEFFAKGWAYTVEPKGGAGDLRELLLGAETKRWIKSELSKLRDFLATSSSSSTLQTGTAALSLQDGGEPMPGVLSQMSIEDLARFEAQFLACE